MTALAKPDGGVRGIVAGDVIRKQLGDAATAAPVRPPHGSGVQGLTEIDRLTTVTSVDGVSAFDVISRSAVLC